MGRLLHATNTNTSELLVCQSRSGFHHWFANCGTIGHQYCRPLAATSADKIECGQSYQRNNNVIQDGVVNARVEAGE